MVAEIDTAEDLWAISLVFAWLFLQDQPRERLYQIPGIKR
jgi:hypothetical protein